MKVLEDPVYVLHIMDAKLDELYERFDKANGEEAAEISGQVFGILEVQQIICEAVAVRDCFAEEDLEYTRQHIADKGNVHYKTQKPEEAWFLKGADKGFDWARLEIEDRMEEEP